MGNDVFANGRELSCKAGSGKSICAFPDVCFTPPQTPATPPGVPIPYPNTGMASDTSKGSRDVKITRKEVMLKNKSMFKKSVGDQAGCAPKKGVVTSQTGGKVYFNSWSMDVKIEGENAVRHLDLTTHNHGSVPGNTPTWPYIDQMSGGFPDEHDCKDDIIKEQEACANFEPYLKGGPSACTIVKKEKKLTDVTSTENLNYARHATVNFGSDSLVEQNKIKKDYHYKGGETKPNKTRENWTVNDVGSAQECLTARACQLLPYKRGKGAKTQSSCCKGQTAHHLIPASSFFESGRGEDKGGLSAEQMTKKYALKFAGKKKQYVAKDAPNVCVFGPNQTNGSHGIMHSLQGRFDRDSIEQQATHLPKKNGDPPTGDKYSTIKYKDARENALVAHKIAFPTAGCSKECLRAQVDEYHKDIVGEDHEIKSNIIGNTEPEDAMDAAVKSLQFASSKPFV